MKGYITITHLIGWGLTIALAVGGILWTKVGMTDAQVDEVKMGQSKTNERLATVEESVRRIDVNINDIKDINKEILRRIK